MRLKTQALKKLKDNKVEYEISKFNPCDAAIEFRSQYKTFEDAWMNCPRGDWMLWIAGKLEVDLRVLTKAKALCALTVKHLMKDERSIRACEVALRFADGQASREELDDAVDDARAARAAFETDDADFYAAEAADAAVTVVRAAATYTAEATACCCCSCCC